MISVRNHPETSQRLSRFQLSEANVITSINIRPSNSHGLTVRLTVWDAISRSHGFASKSHGRPENL